MCVRTCCRRRDAPEDRRSRARVGMAGRPVPAGVLSDRGTVAAGCGGTGFGRRAAARLPSARLLPEPFCTGRGRAVRLSQRRAACGSSLGSVTFPVRTRSTALM
jgi:hypothetical protein